MKNNIKITLIACLVFLTGNLTNAQDCGIELLPEQVQYMNDTRIDRANTDVSLFSEEEVVVNFQIAAHIVRDSKGEKGITLDSLNAAIDDLNNTFEQVGFKFHICSIDYIDEDHYANGGVALAYRNNSIEYQMALPYLVENAVNIFFVPVLSNPDHNGWSSFPSYINDFGKDWTVMKNSAANNGSTLAHEMGHYFSLYHTHESAQGRELVNRTTGCGPGIGDGLCDTPADPTGMVYNGQGDKYHIGYCTDYYTCEFDGVDIEHACDLTDSNGDTYMPSTKNVMSYNYPTCRLEFSSQQIDRMQRSYLYDRNYLNNNCEITCDNMLTVYDWLKEEVCSNESTTDISIYYYNDVWNYLDIQKENERSLYLSNGDLFCTGSTVEACIAELGITEIVTTCNLLCGNVCSDQNACNFGEAGMCIYGNRNCPDLCDEDTCIFGCTNPTACNYNPEATIEDYSCHYGNLACAVPCDNSSCVDGCTDTYACDYEPTATRDDGSCAYNCLPACDAIYMEYAWLEADINCEFIKEYSYQGQFTFIEVQNQNKEKTLYFQDGRVFCSGDRYDTCIERYELNQVLVACNCGNIDIAGCTDINACNYNPEATEDDNSCNYGNIACENPCDDNTCVNGCTNPNACNFNSLANIDDGSCYECAPSNCIDCPADCPPCSELVICLEEPEINVCAPVTVQPKSLEDFIKVNPESQLTLEVDQITEAHQYYTSINYMYTFTDNFGNQQTCGQTHHIANQFLQVPVVTDTFITCQDELFSYIKLGTKEYKIYSENNRTKGEELVTCNTPGLHCSTTGLGVNTDIPDTHKFWLTQFFSFPNGAICESTAAPFWVEVYPKPVVELSTLSLTTSPGQVIVLNDLVTFTEDRNGNWTGENIVYLMDTDGENTPIFNTNSAGTYKLYYTVKNEYCQKSYLLVVNVSNAAKIDDKAIGQIPNANRFEGNQTFEMHPNPASHQVYIELPDESNVSNEMQLLDLTGKVLQQQTITDTFYTLEVSDLPKGIYLINIQNAHSQSTKKLLVE